MPLKRRAPKFEMLPTSLTEVVKIPVMTHTVYGSVYDYHLYGVVQLRALEGTYLVRYHQNSDCDWETFLYRVKTKQESRTHHNINQLGSIKTKSQFIENTPHSSTSQAYCFQHAKHL